MSNQEFSKTEMQTVVDQGLDLIQWRHLFEIDFQAGIFLTKVSKQREKKFRCDGPLRRSKRGTAPTARALTFRGELQFVLGGE